MGGEVCKEEFGRFSGSLMSLGMICHAGVDILPDLAKITVILAPVAPQAGSVY